MVSNIHAAMSDHADRWLTSNGGTSETHLRDLIVMIGIAPQLRQMCIRWTSVLQIMAMLSSCRKDVKVGPTIDLCDDLSVTVVSDPDTATAVYGQIHWQGMDVDQDGESDVFIYCGGQDVAPGPSFAWDAWDQLSVNRFDSVGIVSTTWDWCSYASFSPGDTLWPFSDLTSNITLYFTDWLGSGPCGDYYTTLRIGIVKIIEGEKYVGMLELGTSANQFPGNRRYWLERMVMADCPGKPMIVPE